MTDALLRWDLDAGGADLALELGALAVDDGIATALIVSLFSDALVERDELPLGHTDRRGWWGDGVAPAREDGIGSRLWLSQPAKARGSLPARVEGWARDALRWLVDEGHAVSVAADAAWGARSRLDLVVTVLLPSGEESRYVFGGVA